jgi:hypothetical protein
MKPKKAAELLKNKDEIESRIKNREPIVFKGHLNERQFQEFQRKVAEGERRRDGA